MKKYIKSSTSYPEDILYEWAKEFYIDERVFQDGLNEPDEPEVIQEWLEKKGYHLDEKQFEDFIDDCWSYIDGVWDHCIR